MMATAFPTLACVKSVVKTIMPGAVDIQTSRSGKETRAGIQVGVRYRYDLDIELLNDTDRTAILALLAATLGELGEISYTDPDTSATVYCRLDGKVSYIRLCAGMWTGAKLSLVTLL
jgi:hypothetical protein